MFLAPDEIDGFCNLSDLENLPKAFEKCRVVARSKLNKYIIEYKDFWESVLGLILFIDNADVARSKKLLVVAADLLLLFR
jgi:hypothetical protein